MKYFCFVTAYIFVVNRPVLGSTSFNGLPVLPIFLPICYCVFWPTPTSEILHDPKYGQHGFLQLSEVRLHFVDNGDKRKPLMLFLHGFPEFWFSWRNQLVHFAKTHWVVAIDMRGYGSSDKPLGNQAYDISHLHNDILEVVWALGRQNCILVAHDWGGSIAWTVAAYHPEVIHKLIIIDGPHPNVWLDLMFTSPVQFLRSQYVFFFQTFLVPEVSLHKIKPLLFNLFFGSFLPREEIKAYEHVFPTVGSWNPPINYYRNIFKSNFTTYLPKIQVPTLIIWGETDIFLDSTMPDHIKPYVENVQIRIIPNAGHFVQAKKPREVNRWIEGFLGDHI